VGVDEGVERLVAFAVALGLPGADHWASALEAGDDALGGQLAKIVNHERAALGLKAREAVQAALASKFVRPEQRSSCLFCVIMQRFS